VRRCIALAVALLFAAGLMAELPPQHYRDRQSQAPDYYDIEVLSVQQDSLDSEHTQVDVSARVLVIHRCSSARAVGDVLHIHYVHEHFKQPVFGPRPIPLLQEGQTCPAWLNPDTGNLWFAPAARGWSFEEMIW